MMGCDIHIYTEAKKEVNKTEAWVNIDCWRYNPYHEIYPDDENEYEIQHIYTTRNYMLFAVLANVRNYSHIEPIDKPRGLPHDISKTTLTESVRYGSDGHSHSWLSLAELKHAKSERGTIQYTAWVSDEGKQQIECGQMPDIWCYASSRGCQILVEWEHVFHYLDPIIECMEHKKRDEKVTDNEIRIVFWFDN